MKQETLEDAAERHRYGLSIHNFVRGAKWQQERSYSEEDMEIAFGTISTNWICFEEFIEQFKKK